MPTELTRCDQSLPALGIAQCKWGGWGPIEACPCHSFVRNVCPWVACLISGSRCCHKSRQSCGRWLQQVRAINSAWQIARSLDEWLRDLSIWQGWRASRMHYLGPDMVYEQTCQSSQSFLYLSDIMPKLFLNAFYGTDSSFPLVSHISWPLEINSALNISLDVSYDVCMHDTRNMEWYVMLKNA